MERARPQVRGERCQGEAARRAVAVLLGVALVAMSACASNHPDASHRAGSAAAATPSGPVARIGAALSLSGSARHFGAAQRNGIRLAQDEINANHLLGNTRLEVLIEDDGSDRDLAAAAFRGFIEHGQVLAIMGPTLSDTALSVDPLAQQAGVPVLAISNAALGITQIGNSIFRVCLSESQVVPEVVKTVRSNLKIHSAALLHSDTDSNRAGSQAFKKALQDVGVRITTEQVFAAEQTDLSSQMDEIGATHPDALFVTSPGGTAAGILVQARQRALPNVPIIGNSSFNSDTVLRSAGPAAEGLIVGSSWSAANPSPRNQQFIRSYRARYGFDPDPFGAQAYAGVYILATALRDAGSISDPRAERDALERIGKLDTPLGLFSFDDRREAMYPLSVQIVRGGRFQLL